MLGILPIIIFFHGVLPFADTLTLPKVKGITATEVTAQTVQLQWDARKQATKYNVRVRNGEAVAAQISTKQTQVTIEDLQADTDYSAQVRLLKGKRKGPWSKAVQFTTKANKSDDDSALYDQYKGAAGTYTGEWQNLTFGTTGDTSMVVEIEPTGSAEFTIDLDGFVFGLINPDPKTYASVYDADGIIFSAQDDDLFGDLTIAVEPNDNDTAQFEITALDIPMGDIDQLEATGTLYTDSLDLNYTITFNDTTTAEGILNLTKTSE